MDIWSQLGIDPTRDASAIRRAYAARLRQLPAGDGGEAVDRLRDAFRAAMAQDDLEEVRPDGEAPLRHGQGMRRWGGSIHVFAAVVALAVAVFEFRKPIVATVGDFAHAHGYQRSIFGKPFALAWRDAFRPMEKGGVARPVDSSPEVSAAREAALDALVRVRFGSRPPHDARLDLEYVVQADGTVTMARAKSSTFGDAAFDEAAAAIFLAHPYPPSTQWSATGFIFHYRSPEKHRELADIEAGAATFSEPMNRLVRKFFPQGEPPDRGLVATYLVQPDGTVTDARIGRSTYAMPEFEQAVVSALAERHYPERPDTVATPFELRMGRRPPEEPPAEAAGPR